LRHEVPLVALIRIAECAQRLQEVGRKVAAKLSLETNTTLIPFAYESFQKAKSAAWSRLDGHYVADTSMGLQHIAVKWSGMSSLTRVCDLSGTLWVCSCLFPQAEGMPCRHVLIALRQAIADGLLQVSAAESHVRMFHVQYFKDSYIRAYSGKPITRPLLNTLIPDETKAPFAETRSRKR
jgi:hypothetical protein